MIKKIFIVRKKVWIESRSVILIYGSADPDQKLYLRTRNTALVLKILVQF
jgi:hypothetical protein